MWNRFYDSRTISFSSPWIIIILITINQITFTMVDGYDIDDENDVRVLGVCSRPNLPPKSRIRFASPEKVRFGENETIFVMCEENQFPHHVQKRTCRHGHWIGPQTRCGKPVLSNVVMFEVFECENTRKPLLVQYLNQTDEPPYPLPPNSFHYTRVPESVQLSVKGSSCYKFFIEFDQKIEIAFLLVDINMLKSDRSSTEVEKPRTTVYVDNRLCISQHISHQMIEQDEIFGNYFYCDLIPNNNNTNGDDSSLMKTKSIVVEVKTSTPKNIGLEAIFVGETYKKQVKQKWVPDCGALEIQRTGVFEQRELGHTLVSCNDSFYGPEKFSARKAKFMCTVNGVWQGEWPDCRPKQVCKKSEILNNLDDSIMIESIGNVYYFNNSHWEAIDYSWIQYACSYPDGIMIGKNERTCWNGKWTNKFPHCTQAFQSKTVAIIIVALIFLIIIFSLIVYFSITFHSKKIHRKLESTKNEIEANNAQFNKISEDFYNPSFATDTIYEDFDSKETYSMPMYEMTNDEVRYDAEPHLPIGGGSGLESLTKTTGLAATSANNSTKNEPEYLVMTESIINNRAQYANTPSYHHDKKNSFDLYE